MQFRFDVDLFQEENFLKTASFASRMEHANEDSL